MIRCPDNQINASFIDISRIKWLILLLWSSFFRTTSTVASSKAPADYQPAPGRTDSIPERHQRQWIINPSLQIHGPFTKPSRKSSPCLGYPYFLRSPQPETVPIRRFLLLSPIIPLYPRYVRLPVLTTISSTPQIASNVPSLRRPMIAFRRPPSLRNLLVRAEVPPTNDSSIPPIQHGMFRCTSRCVTCQEHILESDSFKSHTTGAHHKIRGHITCTTSNIIYLISCRICGIQYIGETKNPLKKRFYGHRSTVKTQKLDTPVGQHFNLPNHSISDMILQGIEALANRRESVRLSREKMWIKLVHTIHPHGLNIQEGND